MKKCFKCELDLPFEMFNKDKSKNDGFAYQCKSCLKKYKAEYWIKNKGVLDVKEKEHRKKNRERYTNYDYKCKSKNPEKYKEIDKRYRKKNFEKRKAARKIWDEKRFSNEEARTEENARIRIWKIQNKDKVNSHHAKRRAQKLNAVPGWANMKQIRKFYTEAKSVTNSSGIQHHVHHVVPLVSDVVCGLHCESNLAVITAKENLSIGNRTWPDMP